MANQQGLRGKVFSALTGTRGDVSGSAEGDVRGQLLAIGGESTRTRSGIDLTAAADKLGVSRRTVERWARAAETGTGQRPNPAHAKQLATKARQAASTKAGRKAARAASTVGQTAAARGARVSITAHQGPHERDYMRNRTTQLDLDPQDAQAMMEAWEQGGEKGFMSWAAGQWDSEYLDDWRFGDVDEIGINPF